MLNKQSRRQSEGGNVLFLILIAVALFAALSYVVTQSTRSGGGSTEREKSVLSSAQMTQYPTALRTSLIRMVLAGVDISQIKFNDPSSPTVSTNQMIFHANGGAATFQAPPPTLSASGTTAIAWHFNANFDVPGIGTDGAGGNDVIAFLPGIGASVCKQVNDQLGISTAGCTGMVGNVPIVPATVTNANIIMDDTGAPLTVYTFPTTDQPDITGTGCTTGFSRQASGCFYESSQNQYVFYSVLLER